MPYGWLGVFAAAIIGVGFGVWMEIRARRREDAECDLAAAHGIDLET